MVGSLCQLQFLQDCWLLSTPFFFVCKRRRRRRMVCKEEKKKNGMQRREEDSWPCMHESNNRFCNVNFSEFVLSNRRRSTN